MGETSRRGPRVFIDGLTLKDGGGNAIDIQGDVDFSVRNLHAENIRGSLIRAASSPEVEPLLGQLPPAERAGWRKMFDDAAAGAAGGMTVEAVKAALVITLKAMGLSA